MHHLMREAEKVQPRVMEWRREFHRFPEPSMQEFETARRLERELHEMGVKPRRVGETGVVADIQGADSAPIVALRADTDALQLQEETGLDFASENPGHMHACGHDAHMAMLLGAAEILNARREQLPGTVRLFFQPGEESAQGAKSLIAAGEMENVAAVFGLHVWADLPAGVFSVEPGPRMAFADIFHLEIQGKGGHAAAPHQTVDAVVTAAATVANLQTLVSRQVSPLDPVVLTVGKMQAGTRWNIIADRAELEGTVRGFNPELAAGDLVARLVHGTSEAYGAEARLDYRRLVPVCINDEELAALGSGVVAELFGDRALGHLPKMTGSEDFAYYGEHVPIALGFLGVRNEAKGADQAHHHPAFDLDEEPLARGVAWLVGVVQQFLEHGRR